MRAAQYLGDRQIVTTNVLSARPGPYDVEIEVAYTGICGTDLHILHGDMDSRVTTPAVIGHEMSGRVAVAGAAVTAWQPRDPVTVMPLIWCGECPACRAGHQHVCSNLVFVGIDSPGSMTQRWIVPETLLVRLPDTVSLRRAALVEPAAVAVHDVGRADLRPGEKVVVVGGGPVGGLIALVAATQGAAVLVLEPDPARRAVLAGLGLLVADPADSTAAELVDDWSEGVGADVTFEVSGSQNGLDTAIDAIRVRGRMVLVAIHPHPRPVNLHRVFWRELTLIGARVYERADFEHAVELIASGALQVEPLISRVVPLEKAAQAFAALESGGDVMKVLVDCQAST